MSVAADSLSARSILLVPIAAIPTTMNRIYTPYRARRLALAATLLLTLQNSGLAQTAEPTQADKNTPAAKEEVLQLSPFVVDAEKDQGYQAATTLAGSRVRTELKDVSQSITVLTKAFLDDLGAANVNDVLAYTVGAEGSRSFTASWLGGDANRPTDGLAINPTTGNRIRGLGAADIKRDYFSSIGHRAGFDSYNIDEVTIVRGPNSILAGVGSASGIINHSPQLAGLSKSHNSVSYEIGSYGNQRATLNSNYVAVPDVLAFRVAGLWGDYAFRQKPAFGHDKRIYFTTTYKPWKSTTVRASYEVVKLHSNWPNSITPEDGVSQWIALGKPIYDSKEGIDSSYLWNQPNKSPSYVFDQNGSPEAVYHYTGKYFAQQNLSGVKIWTPQRMHDNRYIPDTMNLNPSTYDTKQKTFNFSLEQQILPGLVVKVDYVNERVRNNDVNLSKAEFSTYSIDVNKYLPDGSTLNPHFKETYFEYFGNDNLQTDDDENTVMRATLAYNLDLQKTNKWLGRYALTGFGEKRKLETHHLQWGLRDVPRKDEFIRSIRYYMGGKESNGYVAQVAPRQPGLVQNVPYGSGTINTYYGLRSDARMVKEMNSSAAVLQAFWWDDRVVVTAGIRHDEERAGYSNTAMDTVALTDALFAAPATLKEPVSDNTSTLGVVVHALKWLSLHYNRSENFTPNAGVVDLKGEPTPFPTGLTKDYGFSLNLLDGKLHAKVNWFDLTAANAASGAASFPLARWTLPLMEWQIMPNLARQAGIEYRKERLWRTVCRSTILAWTTPIRPTRCRRAWKSS